MENKNIRYVCIDIKTGNIVRETNYANRNRLRRWADRQDAIYGAVRFVCQISR